MAFIGLLGWPTLHYAENTNRMLGIVLQALWGIKKPGAEATGFVL